MERVIRIGTRGSLLALTQTGQVAEALVARGVFDRYETVVIKTSGDRIQDRSLSEIGGKGLFIKEIEEAMLRGEVDLAVHSMKDLPGTLAAGLCLEGVLPRETPNDVLISNSGADSLLALPAGTVLGTSSLRRQAIAKALRPDLRVIPLRGNVDTRLERLRTRHEGMDATILAGAGLNRLGRALPNAATVPVEQMIPAICQGTLGLEVREEDKWLRERLATVRHLPTFLATQAERSLLFALSGSCRVPLGGYAHLTGDGRLQLDAILASPDGTRSIQVKVDGNPEEGAALGIRAANRLLEEGGESILRDLNIAIEEERLRL